MATEPFFKARIAGREYELSSLTLGDLRKLKAHFGLTDLQAFNGQDPDHITGALYLCLVHDGMSHEAALQEVEAIDLVDFEDLDEENEIEALDPEENPTAAANAGGKPIEAGNPVTPRSKRGSRSTQKS